MAKKIKSAGQNKPAAKNKNSEKKKNARKKQTHQADQNRRKKARVAFQYSGTEQLKFVRAVELSDKLAEILGRSVWKIIPLAIRSIENGVPVISIFRDDENKNLILRCDRVKLFEILSRDEDGNAVLAPIKQ